MWATLLVFFYHVICKDANTSRHLLTTGPTFSSGCRGLAESEKSYVALSHSRTIHGNGSAVWNSESICSSAHDAKQTYLPTVSQTFSMRCLVHDHHESREQRGMQLAASPTLLARTVPPAACLVIEGSPCMHACMRAERTHRRPPATPMQVASARSVWLHSAGRGASVIIANNCTGSTCFGDIAEKLRVVG